MGAQRSAIEMHAVAVDMAERTKIDGAEGLNPVGRGLDDVAGGMDFSPLVALIGIQIVASILLRILPPTL